MKKMLAWLLCLVLTALPGLAEEAETVRITTSEFTVEMDGESCESKMIASLDGEIEFGELGRVLKAEGLHQMLSGFMKQLDGHPEDQFVLTRAELPEWTAGMEVFASVWLENFGSMEPVEKLSVRRDSLGYTLIVEGDFPADVTLRYSGSRIMAKLSMVAMGVTVYAAEDGGVQMSINGGIDWEEGTEVGDLTVKYQPQPEGGAEYSLVHQYQSWWSQPVEGYDDQSSRLSVFGSVDAKGIHTAKVRYARDAETIPDVAIAFQLSGEVTEMEESSGAVERSFGSSAVALYRAYDDFVNRIALQITEPMVMDVLHELENDPVAGVIWAMISES